MARARPTDPSPLQAAIAEALDAAPHARDYYDRELQRLTQTKGKPLYDIERGKSKNPSAERLALIARVLGLPHNHFLPKGEPPANAEPFKMEGAPARRMNLDVPIYGTALGAAEVYEGEAVEQTRLNTGDIVGYMRRPVILDGRADVYGIYVQGSSMAPRHKDGETLFVDPKRSPMIGDDVVVYLREMDEQDGERAACVLVKELVRRAADYIELLQHEPRITFRLGTGRVLKIHRVIPWSELVA